ncbi:hypothetical protein V3C99_014268 [Haemonchus contortus]
MMKNGLVRNACDSADGTWFFVLDTFAADYAHGGEELNPKYNCFDVSKDNTVLQKFKVDLVKPLFNFTEAMQHTSQLANLDLAGGYHKDGYLCKDDQLRNEVVEAVKDAEGSCQGLVNALASKLNRPGWAMNCVVLSSPKGTSRGAYFSNENFCRYDVLKDDKTHTLT